MADNEDPFVGQLRWAALQLDHAADNIERLIAQASHVGLPEELIRSVKTLIQTEGHTDSRIWNNDALLAFIKILEWQKRQT